MKNFNRFFFGATAHATTCTITLADIRATTFAAACKTSRAILFAAASLAVLTFSSCGPEEPVGPEYTLFTVDFEDADLSGGAFSGSADREDYSEKGVAFPYYFTEWEGGFSSWSGATVSDKTDKTTSGYTNQFSVYADGGAGGSSQFGVVYYSEYDGPAEFRSASSSSDLLIDHIYVANSTYAYLAMKNGESPARPFTEGDWFKLTLTGYDKEDKETGAVDVYLADYRDGKQLIISNWTKVDLTPLGQVHSVSFTFSSSDNAPEGWMNTPAYVCIDNIAFYRESVNSVASF